MNISIGNILANPLYYAITCILEMALLIYIIFIINPFDIKNNYKVLTNFIIIFVGFFQFITFLFIKTKYDYSKDGIQTDPTMMDFIKKILFTFLTIIVLTLLIILIVYGTSKYNFAQNIFVFFINISIIFTILSVIYSFFHSKFKSSKNLENKPPTILTLIGSLIMYIPCIIIDLIEWIKHEYNITTRNTWILFTILVSLISIRFIIPKLFTTIYYKDLTILLKNPVYLNNENFIGAYDLISEDNSKNYKYSLSFWFWINPQPGNTGLAYNKYTNILNYGNKPAILFNSRENKLKIVYKLNKNEDIIVNIIDNIKNQKWNNLVINYDKGTIDVFLNGNLEISKQNIAPYLNYEDIFIGEKNGIEGAVCNITYSKNIVDSYTVKNIYNVLSKLSTPIL